MSGVAPAGGPRPRPILAANWKMNVGPQEARAFVATFVGLSPARDDRSVIFFPSAISLAAVRDGVAGRPDLQLGVQNIYWEDKGAFTGELSAPMARSAGAVFALVGHSERRHVFHETDDETARKCEAAVRGGLSPVLCVGELLEQRQSGETEAVVLRQLRAGLSRLTAPQIGEVVVAYEPVWAIGTGKTATPADASAVHRSLHATLRDLAPRGVPAVPVLYGGSVTPANAPVLLAAPGVDGLLVGGASCDPQSWAALVAAQPAR